MIILNKGNDSFTLKFSLDELQILKSSISYVYDSMWEEEFPIKIGNKEKAKNLLQFIIDGNHIIECIDDGESEISIMNNSLNEACNNMTKEDFYKKIGHDRESAKLLLKSIHSV